MERLVAGAAALFVIVGCSGDDSRASCTTGGASGKAGSGGGGGVAGLGLGGSENSSGGTAAMGGGAAGGGVNGGNVGASGSGTAGAGAPDGGTAGDGGTASDGGAADGGTAGDGAPHECVSPAATTTTAGILTAFPQIEVVLGATADFAITSLNFVVEEDGDTRGPLLKMFAEFKNIGTGLKCQFLPDVSLDGEEIVTTVQGPPYYLKLGDTLFNTVDACIAPGQSAIMIGLQRGISLADLANASLLLIDARPLASPSSQHLVATPPTFQAAIGQVAEGYALSGTFTYTEAVHNQGVYVYPRDSRGLIVAELPAFPGSLGAHPAGSTASFQTETIPCSFQTYELFQTWIRD